LKEEVQLKKTNFDATCRVPLDKNLGVIVAVEKSLA